MRWRVVISVGLLLIGAQVQALPGADGLVAWWAFDDVEDVGTTTDRVSGRRDALIGSTDRVRGVVAGGLRLDGYTSGVRRPAEAVPRLADGFTVEAWVALQTLPWNWTAIVDQGAAEAGVHRPGVFFGIDGNGRPGVRLTIDEGIVECVSREPLPLLDWAHVAATFDPRGGIDVFANGRHVRSCPARGTLPREGLGDLLIGRSHRALAPVGTEREASRSSPSPMVLDGLLDEVKLYDRKRSGSEIARAFAATPPAAKRPLERRALPSGPLVVPRRFAAYSTRLEYAREWERPWRVGDSTDILVTFDEVPVRLVFWRGTSYGASWITENGRWMGDQSLEDSGTGWGLSEHMADKQCRYSHVRLLESHDARVVVHWRYAVADTRYTINHPDPATGWGDWADEYYTIYPDAVATRRQVLWSGQPGGFQWQETIFFSQPGTRPEDNIELEALSLANMRGESETYSWAEGAPESFPRPEDANIQVTNLKSRYRPFAIFDPEGQIVAFGEGGGRSRFPWWNHWPVALLPSDGRKAMGPDRPSHSSLSNYKPVPVRGEGDSWIAVSLYGMTTRPAAELLPLARSWIDPATLRVLGKGYESRGYDRSQRAYVLARSGDDSLAELRFTLLADEGSPVVNPAFLIRSWGGAEAALRLDGRPTARGRGFRFGHRHGLSGTDLVVWIRREATEPLEVRLSPVPLAPISTMLRPGPGAPRGTRARR